MPALSSHPPDSEGVLEQEKQSEYERCGAHAGGRASEESEREGP
jgi:hypothetical protein